MISLLIPSCNDDSTSDYPKVSGLRPVLKEQAVELGAYARTLLVKAEGSSERAMAWSMINVDCQERTLAEQYAISSASDPLPNKPPVMCETDLTVDAIQGLIKNHSFDTATISVTGPLITEQTMVYPDGKTFEGEPYRHNWPYHHSVVLNVEGELMVLDLSIRDEPLPINEWVKGFVSPDVECCMLDENKFKEVWVYWMTVMNGWKPEGTPPCECAYTITPTFTMGTQDLQYDQLRTSPSVLEGQTDSFLYFLREDYGFEPEESEIPYYTSIYNPKSMQDLCDWGWGSCDFIQQK